MTLKAHLTCGLASSSLLVKFNLISRVIKTESTKNTQLYKWPLHNCVSRIGLGRAELIGRAKGGGCRKVEANRRPGGAPDLPEAVPLLSP